MSIRTDWLKNFCIKKIVHTDVLWNCTLREREEKCLHHNRKSYRCIDCKTFFSPAVRCILDDRDALDIHQIDLLKQYLCSR